jgi:Gluconate 2-dehydrogenase subunit 3
MMINRWSRRKFLETGVVSAITVTGTRAASFFSSQNAETQPPEIKKNSIIKLDRDLLRVSMDELIPAGDGMPAASEVDSVNYLDDLAGENEQVAKELRASLNALEEVSNGHFKTSFLSLSRELRVKALITLEERNPNSFRDLRDYVYEAYYLQPRVRQLIGYEPHPTNGPGPMIQPFDESLLAAVRKKPKHYREV